MIGDGQNLLLVCPHTKYWAVQQLFIQLSMSITQDTTSFLDFLNLDMSNPPSPPIPDLDDYNINPFSPPASLPPMTSIPISRPASQTTQPMEQWVTRLLPLRHLWSYPSSAVGKGVNRRATMASYIHSTAESLMGPTIGSAETRSNTPLPTLADSTLLGRSR